MNKAAQNHIKSTNHSQQYRHSTRHFSESSFNIFEQTIQGTRKHFVHCYKKKTKLNRDFFVTVYKKNNWTNLTTQKSFFFLMFKLD